MQEVIKLIIGIVVLALGIPLGHYLSKFTKEELKSGRRWFRLIIVLSLILAVISLIIGNDVLLFSFLFIAIVSGMNLKK
jgi:hypothetical protein